MGMEMEMATTTTMPTTGPDQTSTYKTSSRLCKSNFYLALTSLKLIKYQHCRDTQHLALLIDERDQILENLEIAETRYISSFRLTTPDPSIADLQPRPPPEEPTRPYISRPRVLGGITVRFLPQVT